MNCSYSLLQQESLLHIIGPDTLTFLQGQTTCDTRIISESRAALGVYCTPQGRVVCDFLLVQLAPDHYALRMRRDIRSAAAKVFGKYIVFSKAELDDTRDDWNTVGVWGADSRQILESVFGAAPETPLACVTAPDFVLVQMDEQGSSFECFLRADSPKMAELAARATAAEEALWQQTQISAGIARIEAATVEAFVPQVLNYDLTGHISFTKGCYTGQEVVARLHYRGKSKRRSYLADLPEPARAGDALFAADSEQSAGNVVNAGDGAHTLALVATTGSAAEHGLHLHAPDGPLLKLLDPPYPVSSD